MLLNSHLCNQMADGGVYSCCEGLPHGQHRSPSSWALRLSAAPVQNLSRPAESLPWSFVQRDKHLQSKMFTSPGCVPPATVHLFILKVMDHFPLSVGDSEVKVEPGLPREVSWKMEEELPQESHFFPPE